jgi:hypothetical protein
MDKEGCEPRKNPWWFHPKLYIIVLWASLIASLVYPSPVISGFFWIWIGYGITVGVLGIKNMARRRRLRNSA